MSPFAALRQRRSSAGLPEAASDDELLAWSEALVHPKRPPRTEPLRIARHATASAPARRRLRLTTQ